MPLRQAGETIAPTACTSCPKKLNSCVSLDALNKKFPTKPTLDYLALFCSEAALTDAKLAPVLAELNSWTSDASQKELITSFGTIAAFRNGIIANPNLIYAYAALQTTDLSQLTTVLGWKTTYPVLFADLKTLDKAKQTAFYTTFNGKTTDLQTFQSKVGLAQTWGLCSITNLTHLQTIHQWRSGKTIAYQTLTGPAAEARLLADVQTSIQGKTVLETIEDLQKRLSFVIQTGGATNDLISVQTNVDREYIISTYSRAYKVDQNMGIDVGVSSNRLVPDYRITMAGASSTRYLYPRASLATGREPVVRIRMTGKRKSATGDFRASNEAAGLAADWGSEAPTGYVWHHLDDFTVDAMGIPWCTMQLVQSNAHTGVGGMAHSGSVAQWKAYFMTKTKAPSQLFYEQ